MLDKVIKEIHQLGIEVSESSIIVNIKNVSTLDKLFKIFEQTNFKFDLFDIKYPSMSDEGAYFSYCFDLKNKKWKMTFGNHGWTGGIYTVEKNVIINQITNLIMFENKIELIFKNVSFFANYKEKSAMENLEMNAKLSEIHKTI